MAKIVIELTEEDRRTFDYNIKEIEKWQGDAYQIFDDVGTALHNIKCQMARLIYDGKKIVEVKKEEDIEC